VDLKKSSYNYRITVTIMRVIDYDSLNYHTKIGYNLLLEILILDFRLSLKVLLKRHHYDQHFMNY
jgi:hypothetical protein